MTFTIMTMHILTNIKHFIMPHLNRPNCIRSCQVLVVALVTWLVACPSVLAIDTFDRHTASVLKQTIEGSTGVKSITQQLAGKLKPLDKDQENACLIVETTSGNLAKVLVTWGFRKSGSATEQKLVPVLMLDRFVTYERGRGDSTVANGKNVMLFPGFGFDFDLGQVVPKGFDADVEFTDKGSLTCLDQATAYGVDGSQLPKEETTPGKAGDKGKEKSIVTPEDFSGVWKVDGDGRWQGEWDLSVTEEGVATGKFLSAESEASYPIIGQIGALPHQIRLQVQFNNTTQVVDAFLWTKDKSTLAGTFTMEDRKFGLFATRQTK